MPKSEALHGAMSLQAAVSPRYSPLTANPEAGEVGKLLPGDGHEVGTCPTGLPARRLRQPIGLEYHDTSSFRCQDSALISHHANER